MGDEYSRAVLEIFDKLSVIFAKLSVHVTGVDEAEKDWRLFDNWDRRFDKLPVISAKLSLRVMGADVAKKDWHLFDIWDRRFDKLPVISVKLSLRVIGADVAKKKRLAPLRYLGSALRQITRDFRKAEFACDGCRRVWKSKMLLRFLSLPLRFFEWPLRILSSPLRSLKSRRVLIFYRGMQFVSKHT
ncbi:hypothetical protein ACFX2I_033760 [Malus domestica]